MAGKISEMGDGKARAVWAGLAGVGVFAGAAVLLALLLADELRPAAVAIGAAVAAVGGMLALLGWLGAERAVGAADERAAGLGADVDRERQARKIERDWNRELRRQISELQHMHGALGDTGDTRTMILRVAISLLGADKGLLLSRTDLDGDGDLDMVIAEGFQNDPAHSDVVQRFAREVLESDETVREDSIAEDGTPADAEIDNLVAIPIYIRDRFSGVVIVCNKPGGFHEHDDEVLLALGDHAGAVLQNTHLHGLLRGSYLKTVAMLADAVEVKDPKLRGHSDEVAKLVANVADRLGIEPERREQLLFGSLLHDVGKIGISERILLKPAALTPEEREVIELHPRIGHRLVEQVPALRPIAVAILHHHERWDGRGYPTGLAGEDIPLEARIIAVADTFSAMTTDRPYREKVSAKEACAELERCAGSQFDPGVVRAFVTEVRRVPEAVRRIDATEPVPELELQLNDAEPLLGFGSFMLVDNLTLLYSHRHLHEVAGGEARRAQVRGRPFAIVLAKLTEIERLNHEQGYAAGDVAIQHVARIVERAAARCGGTAARYGGVCLALLVPGASDEIADRLAEELATDLADGPSVRVAAAVWRDGDSGEDVIERAMHRLTAAAPA